MVTLQDSTPSCAALLSKLVGDCAGLEAFLFPNGSFETNSISDANCPELWTHCKAIEGVLTGECFIGIQGDMLLICRQPNAVDDMVLLSGVSLIGLDSTMRIFFKG